MFKSEGRDASFIRLIGRFLKAGVIEEGRRYKTDKGTPQGGMLSPILVNVYLHYILDKWFEKEVRRRLVGYSQMIRYADDIIICFQGKGDAKRYLTWLKQRFSKVGLRIAEEKSKTIEFGRYVWYRAQREGKRVGTLTFWDLHTIVTRRGKRSSSLGRVTEAKRLRKAIKETKEWIKSIRNQKSWKEWWLMLATKIRGYYQYYGVSGNIRGIRAYYYAVVGLAYKWINRRSEKRSYNWTQFRNLIKYNSLPTPKITHPYPTLGGCVSLEPNDRNGHVRFCEGL